MNITCIIHSLDGGGSERVMALLASELAGRGHRVTLITLDDGSHQRHAVDPAVARQHLNVMAESRGVMAGVINTWRRAAALRDAIVASGPDVILSFCDRTNILTLIAARSIDTPVVISERSDPSQQDLGTVWEWARRRTYRRARTIVALTDHAAAHLRASFQTPVVVIPSAVARPPRLSDRPLAAKKRRVVGAGRLEREKGFDRLIDAFSRLAGDHPHWSLRILGDGSQRDALEQQIRALGLTDRVTMPGWVRPIWDELSLATIFALPSRYEGFPSALLEAMALGVPSVAVDCESGPRAVIDDPHCGLLVPDDVESLCDGLRTLMADERLREELGKGGTSVVRRFSPSAMVDRYEDVLTRAAGAGR